MASFIDAHKSYIKYWARSTYVNNDRGTRKALLRAIIAYQAYDKEGREKKKQQLKTSRKSSAKLQQEAFARQSSAGCTPPVHAAGHHICIEDFEWMQEEDKASIRGRAR